MRRHLHWTTLEQDMIRKERMFIALTGETWIAEKQPGHTLQLDAPLAPKPSTLLTWSLLGEEKGP